MGSGTRENQYKKRFGQGKPVDTYGIPCIHAKPISPGNKATAPKATFAWSLIFKDASVAKKISSESWVRSFVKEIMDYQKLDQIGEGETEILGLKIEMEKGIVQRGTSSGKSYFNLKLVDTGSTIRVYEDNTVSIWDRGGFKRLKIEQLDNANTRPLETDGGARSDGRSKTGTDVVTILVRDYLKKTRFFDQFIIGQETDRVFGVKGTVKANEVATDGPSVTIEYMGKGGRVREVRISADGATVNKHPIVGVETREDGAVSLLYEQGGEIHTTSIKLPDTIVNQGKPVEADSLTTGFDYNDIQGKTGAADLFRELDIKSSEDYIERVAYAVFGGNKKAFDAKYGDGRCEALWKAADVFTESAAEEMLGSMGLDIEKVDVKRGVRPERGDDFLITTKDGKELILDVKYTKDDLPGAKLRMAEKFAENKADLGMIFYKGKYYVVINSAIKYEPLANIVRDSNFKNVNAANSKLRSTNAVNSNLFKMNAANSRLINANATNSDLLNTSASLSNLDTMITGSSLLEDNLLG